MRRRLRRQRQVREALLLDLGALVFELHRHGRREPELLQAKAAELSAVDAEVRALADALEERHVDGARRLGDRRQLRELRHPALDRRALLRGCGNPVVPALAARRDAEQASLAPDGTRGYDRQLGGQPPHEGQRQLTTEDFAALGPLAEDAAPGAPADAPAAAPAPEPEPAPEPTIDEQETEVYGEPVPGPEAEPALEAPAPPDAEDADAISPEEAAAQALAEQEAARAADRAALEAAVQAQHQREAAEAADAARREQAEREAAEAAAANKPNAKPPKPPPANKPNAKPPKPPPANKP